MTRKITQGIANGDVW